VTRVSSGLSLFWIACKWAIELWNYGYDGSERDFSDITLLFSIVAFMGVQTETNGVMLPKFRSDSLLVINPCSIGY
jgi:hypothetical protein